MEGEDRMAQLLPGIHDGDVLVVMDCDKVLDPAQVGEMLRSIEEGADVIAVCDHSSLKEMPDVRLRRSALFALPEFGQTVIVFGLPRPTQ
jgi:hypothetical protein